VWPFPEKAVEELAKKVKRFLVVENNAGQMVIEVKAHAGNVPVDFLGRFNGSVVDPDEVLAKLKEEA
jgi:2-oxoglutarate ferredoxin oxidoreductase subunit alpha